MKRYTFVTLFALAIGASAFASTVRVTVDHHLSAYGPLHAMKTVRAVFTDEPLAAEVRLDVFEVPQIPSSGEHLRALRALPKDGWWKELEWQLINVKTERQVLTSQWRVVTSRTEERGPSTGDNTKAVDVRSLIGRFHLADALAPGDYKLNVTIAGVPSQPFLFAVRSGREDDVRDIYLATKAARTSDFNSYRALQLQRVKINPTNAAAYLELADRSLEDGTLTETQQYLDAAMASMERLMQQYASSYPAWVKQQKAEWEPRAIRIRALQRELPEYFAHRREWRITTDAATGNYVIRSRRDDRVVREIAARP